MSKVPLQQLKKAELIKLATTRCKHRHTYLDHYGCYVPETEERLGFLDIEASNLDADFGIILSYCILDADSRKIYENTIHPDDIAKARAGDEDKMLVTQLIQDMGRFTRLVGYYSSRFDIPYIRARALMTGVPFPEYGSLMHVDLYYVIRNRFKLSSRRLENACRTLLGKTEKTRIENRFWRGGVRGDKESLAYILDHNRKDVLDLEKLYNKVIRFAAGRSVSI